VGINLTGDWAQAKAILERAGKQVGGALQTALRQEAQYLRTKIIEGFTEQAPGGKKWPPLSRTTLAMRRFRGFRGTKALMARGDLRNSITVVERGEAVFVGVLRTARARDGKPLINVAQIHEEGAGPYAIQVTDKMRKFLHAAFRQAGLPARPSTGHSAVLLIVTIPPRPFIKPVWEAEATPESKVRERLEQRLAQAFGGMFGTMGAPPTV
jgi:phage gpG-like protein